MNPNKRALSRIDQLVRARLIGQTLGTYTAARYMYRRGFSLEAALYVLLGR
jgi:hypothetical protein